MWWPVVCHVHIQCAKKCKISLNRKKTNKKTGIVCYAFC